mmetsp:Transcript_30813/g.68260  ORF Transcript_30813/g.68260 Transcript_30813/m.68260 type:complete len:477 (+) Transcript_30813:273-1703(+)
MSDLSTLLTPAETRKLLSIIISADNLALDATLSAFSESFPAAERFRALCTAVLLLEDSKALLLCHRLATWYLLHCSWPSNPCFPNPFTELLIRAATSKSTPAVERALLLRLLQNQDVQELGCSTPRLFTLAADVAAAEAAAASQDLEQQLRQGLTLAPQQQQQAAGGSNGQTARGTGSSAVPSATPSATPSPAAVPPAPFFHLSSSWIRPAPAPLTPAVDELAWLHADLHRDLVWDSSLGEGAGPLHSARELVTKALRGPLLPVQQQQLLADIDAEPGVLARLGLAPRHLPALVEHTPVVAYEVLLRLIKGGSPRVGEYLEVLARTEMSLHSMEVVNRLTTAVVLPAEFVHLYITNCINSCEGTQDKYVQNRLVRLVCVFLHSLIRNRIVAMTELLHELQSFCINFSRIREAAKLFRLLKQLEAGGRLAGDASPTPGMAAAGDVFGPQASFSSLVDDGEEPTGPLGEGGSGAAGPA